MSALGLVPPVAVGIGPPARLTRVSIGRRAVEALWLASFGGVALAVYAATLARDVTWQNGGGDGAELATAAYVWGVAHPPGYPLYLSVLRVAQLAPLGDIGMRSNAFSAFSAVLAAVLLYATLRSLQTSQVAGNDWSVYIGASFGAAVFAFAPLVWSQAVVTEVYAFEAFLFGSFLLTLVRYWLAPGAARLLAVATALGLLISHHPPFAVAVVLLAWSAFVSSRSWQMCLMATLVPLLIAVALFATVALRASFQPWLSWGQASTFGDWFAHVTALSYREYFLSATLGEDARRATYAAATLVRQGGWLATVLAAVGLSWLWQQSRPVAVVCCSLAAFFVVFAVLYNARDSIVYLAPAVTVVALGAGLGATWMLRLLAPKAAIVLAIALLTSIAWQVRSGWPEVDVAHDRSAREWATQRLQDVPHGAVVHVQADDQLFALWYLQGVEELRPDVVVVDDRLLATPWFCRQLGRQHPDVRTCGLGRADPAPTARVGRPIRIESLGTVTPAAVDDMP